MSKFLALLLLLALSPIGAADAPPAAKKPARIIGYSAIQLGRGRQNHLLMRATANGQPIVFMVDSGAALSTIDARKARKLKLGPPPASSGIPAEMVLGSDSRSVVWVDDLQAGGMAFGAGPLVVNKNFATDEIYFKKGRGNVDGIIGWDVLHRFKGVLNCRTQQIYFRTDPGVKTHLDDTLRKAGYSSVDMAEEGGKLLIPCIVAGKKFRMVVDTGAFTTILMGGKMKELGIRTQATSAYLEAEVLNHASVSMTRSLALARMSVAGVPINRDLAVSSENIRFFGPDFLGLMGQDVLSLYSVIIDFEKLRLYIHPLEAAAKAK